MLLERCKSLLFEQKNGGVVKLSNFFLKLRYTKIYQKKYFVNIKGVNICIKWIGYIYFVKLKTLPTLKTPFIQRKTLQKKGQKFVEKKIYFGLGWLNFPLITLRNIELTKPRYHRKMFLIVSDFAHL